ncbi:endonuclease [Rhodobacterales bacterium HKCCE2091]|nr:endonuclease [Rhodobacterales bacterium HKCCE2091]
MRIATYNVEWFNTLFGDDGRMLDDNGRSGRHGISRGEQLGALGHVFAAIDADAVMVIEAPDINRRRDGRAALEGFAARFGLRAREALAGYPNDTQQEIILLYDPDSLDADHAPLGPPTGSAGRDDAPRFDGTFRIDLDIDAKEDLVRWSKPPLEVALTTASGPMRLIGVHAKSKAPHGATGPEEMMAIAIANRRKQLAQCVWLRQRVEQHLEAGDRLAVLGDFNDGPGLDEYEELFGRSGVEIVLGRGQPRDMRLFDPHAARALQSRVSAQPTTARFFLPEIGQYLAALLDYIMVSPALRPMARRWRIWHPFDDRACWQDETLREALLVASDHFPVTLDLETG